LKILDLSAADEASTASYAGTTFNMVAYCI